MTFESPQTARQETRENLYRGRPYTFIGGAGEKDTRDAEAMLLARRKRVRENWRDHERDPGKERIVGAVNELLEADFKRLGLTNEDGTSRFIPIDDADVHVVKHIARGDAGSAVYVPDEDIIEYEWRDSKTGRAKPIQRRFSTLLHESIHSTGHTEFTPQWQSHGASTATPVLVRNGYHWSEGRIWLEKDNPRDFKWFNESVVESWTRKLLQENKKLLKEPFDEVDDSEWNEESDPETGPYLKCRGLYEALVEGIAKAEGVSSESVHDDFRRGHVTGELQYEERIRAAFGDDVFKTLAKADWKYNVEEDPAKYISLLKTK